MEPKIRRKFRAFSLTLAESESGSVAVRFDDAAGGAIATGTASTALTSLTIWASASPAGTFSPLRKSDGSAVELTLSPSTTQGRVYALPDECYATGAIKLVANHASGTAVNCTVMLKG
jgi:hypothetical protein